MNRIFRYFSTVRWRLTLWYVGILFFSSLLLGLTVARLVERSLFSEVDRGLRETMATLSKALDSAYAEMEQPSSRELIEEVTELGLPSDTALILYLPEEPPYRFNAETLPGEPVGEIQTEDVPRLTPVTLHRSGRPWRELHHERRADEKILYRLDLFRNLSPVEAQLALFRKSLFFALIPLVILAAAAGYFLAGRVLSPVDRIATRARHIEASGLDERLNVENPQDEFGRLTLVLNDLFARLQNAFQQQRRFLADAAHELRTPVAVLRAQTEVALQRPRSPQQYTETLETIGKEVEDLSEIVDDLLFIARADASQVPLRRESLDLMEVADETCRGLHALAGKKNVSLHWEPTDEVRVSADPRLMRRALRNLVVNAIRHTPENGVVSVQLRKSDSHTVIEVSDTGPGIAEEDLLHIFDRFFRGNRLPGSTDGGCGLGLAIVKAVMDLHGGQALARNLPDAGATFTLALPA